MKTTKLEHLRKIQSDAYEVLCEAVTALDIAKQKYREATTAYATQCRACANRKQAKPRHKYLAAVRDSYGDSTDTESFSAKSEAMDWARRNLKTIDPGCSVTVERVTLSDMTYATVWTAGNAQSIARWNGDEDIEDPCDAAHRAFVNANDLTD